MFQWHLNTAGKSRLETNGVSLAGVNLTLRWSTTHGRSWEDKPVQIWAGPSGYSSMTSLKSSSIEDQKFIYIIYEKGHKDYDETISFVKVHLFGGQERM